MAQFARPDSDVSTGGWTPTPVWQQVDEVTPDDTTTDVNTGNNPTNDLFEVGLSNVTDPAVATGHVLRVRWRKQGTRQCDVICRLRQGSTTIATISVTDIGTAYQTNTHTLSAAEADSITNYNDLRIQVEASSVGGGAVCQGECTWTELEVPDPPATDDQEFDLVRGQQQPRFDPHLTRPGWIAHDEETLNAPLRDEIQWFMALSAPLFDLPLSQYGWSVRDLEPVIPPPEADQFAFDLNPGGNPPARAIDVVAY